MDSMNDRKRAWKELEIKVRKALLLDVGRFAPLFERLAEVVVPVFRPSKLRGRPELIGSAIVLKLGEKVFLATAAHVVEHFKDSEEGWPLLVPRGDSFFQLRGTSYLTALPKSGTHQDDAMDAAVFHVESEEADVFRTSALLSSDIDVQTDLQATYIATGYPIKPSRYSGTIVKSQMTPIIGLRQHPS